MNEVLIKNYKNGIRVVLDPDIPFEDLCEKTAERFRESARFFQNASLTLTFEGRKLKDSEENILAGIIEGCAGIHIICIFVNDPDKNSVFIRACDMAEDKRAIQEAAAIQISKKKNVCEYMTFPGSLKEGDIYRTKENIIVLGSIPEGAALISEKNVIVLGALNGVVRAGEDSEGCSHVVLASCMSPKKLLINGIRYTPAEEKTKLFFGAKKSRTSGIAFINEDNIVEIKEIDEESLKNVMEAADLNISSLNKR